MRGSKGFMWKVQVKAGKDPASEIWQCKLLNICGSVHRRAVGMIVWCLGSDQRRFYSMKEVTISFIGFRRCGQTISTEVLKAQSPGAPLFCRLFLVLPSICHIHSKKCLRCLHCKCLSYNCFKLFKCTFC